MIRHVVFSLAVAGALLAGTAAVSPPQMTPKPMANMHLPGTHGFPMTDEGPRYSGPPDLVSTISLIADGGGAGTFSIVRALNTIAGDNFVNAESSKLRKQYGTAATTSWITVFNFAVQTAAADAQKAGVKMPRMRRKNRDLALQLVKDGSGNGTFWTGSMLDHLVTMKIHDQTMDAIDAKFGKAADANYHRVTDQAMYDLAQSIGAKNVKLAPFH